MKFYLSFFKIGNEVEKLKSLIPPNKTATYINNARDFAKGQERGKSGLKILQSLIF